jgi:citrate/tricarballylate utilization protein
MAEHELFAEADRQLTICNACRYCEGLCPVFPAIEIRIRFTPDDIRYLGNLCHDCRACEQACMFTPPHEFGITLPRILSEARMESYQHLSWPRLLGRSFSETGRGVLLGLAAIAIVVIAGCILVPHTRLLTRHQEVESFYHIVSYPTMIIPAIILCLYGAAVWLLGLLRFWAQSGSTLAPRPSGVGPILRAMRDSFTVRYLGGGGAGCAYPGPRPSQCRRLFHAAVFWGFLADLVSTTLAFVYQDFLHILPPYSLTSLPVMFGTAGGVALVTGCAGLIVFKAKSDQNQAAPNAYGLDYAFLIFLGLAGLTGLATLIFRSSSAMGVLLIVHLGTVAGLFITAPYGKFVHFVYRTAAIVRYQIEAQGSHPQGGH